MSIANIGTSKEQLATLGDKSFADPFNYPMPGRKDTMSLAVITAERDQTKVTCNQYVSNRNSSQNLSNQDIDGKFLTLIFAGSQPTLFGSRFSTVRKPQTNLKNDDIERSAPRSRYMASNKPDN